MFVRTIVRRGVDRAVAIAFASAAIVVGAPQSQAVDQPAVTVTAPGYTVSIAAAGYGISELKVPVGATVSMLNLDEQDHEVRLEPAYGSSCENMQLVISPKVYRSCTFTDAGTYVMRDPNSQNPLLRMTITVGSPADLLSAVALTPELTRIESGSSVLLAGSVNISRAGVQVDIIAKDRSRETYRKVGQAQTSATGSFSFEARPTRTTVYFVNAIDYPTIVTSAMWTVNVVRK